MRKALACAALLLAAGPAQARTLVDHANGYTLDALGRLLRFEALVVDDYGRVEWLLQKGDRRPTLDSDDVRIDAKGATLLPGLIDAHGHVMLMGQQALSLDLSATRSLDEALAALKTYAEANPQARWILGGGWNQETWGLGRFPTAAELDAVVGDRPVWLMRVDGHASWANSRALAVAGVKATTADPAGGRIERDASGAPAGVLVDAAQALVARHVPRPTEAESDAALAKALETLAAVGLTAVHDAGISAEDWARYKKFGEEGRLSARIYAMADGLPALRAIAPTGPLPWLYDGRLTVRAVKMFADGALGSRGAAMKAPYSDAPDQTGLLFNEDIALRNRIVRAAMDKIQVNIHAIGDAANAQVIDAFAEIVPSLGNSWRHRIEHAQVIDPADISRMASLGLIASVQPTHATSDKAMAEARIGPERLRGAYAWKTLRAAGVRIAAGSDFPVESPNPFYGLHAAITRQDRDNQPPGGWHAEQAMSRVEAFAAFTTGAAYAGHMETMVGSLERGKYADFILVDRNLFEMPAEEIWQTRVLQTWVAGKRVYARQETRP